MRTPWVALTIFALAAPAGAGPAKGGKPRLNLRATPRVAFSPTLVLATAELNAEPAGEEFYCPEVEWDWDDGARSAHTSDCPAWEQGAEVQRRYTAQHAYRQAGVYKVRIALSRGGRVISVAHTTVNVRPGVADMSADSSF
jgi:hypothetical protein